MKARVRALQMGDGVVRAFPPDSETGLAALGKIRAGWVARGFDWLLEEGRTASHHMCDYMNDTKSQFVFYWRLGSFFLFKQ